MTEELLASPTTTFVAQSLVALVAVIVGASLAAMLRSDLERRSQKTETALALFNEFHSPDFIRRRHVAFEQLEAARPQGFLGAMRNAKSLEEEALLSSVLHFFEKVAILWARGRVDRKLLAGLLGRYVEGYSALIFAADGEDLRDEEWGDLLRLLKDTFARMERAR